MRHHAFVAAMGLLLAAAVVPGSSAEAASADPTGFWKKAEQGERPGKFQITKCGQGGKLLCAKIVWLQNPLDSKGRPLHDVRNENPGMRDRPILGLPIFTGLQPVGPNVWKGNIYNPEDGNTYSVTVTQVSRNQINVKGCKAWLLCGERTWLRTSAPAPTKEEVTPAEQVEASAEPEATKPEATEPPSDVAAAAEEPKAEENALAKAEILTPAVQDPAQPGYRYLNAAANAETPAGFSGDNVPSMFAMTKIVAPQSPDMDETDDAPAAETAAAPAAQTAAATPKPAPQPKPQSIQATVAPAPHPAPKPQTASVAPAPKSQAASVAPAPSAGPPADPEAAALESATETAEAGVLEEPPLSRRERRLFKRQQKQGGLLPWLQ